MDNKISLSISSNSSPTFKENRNPVKVSHMFTNNDINEDESSSQHFITEFDSTLDLNRDPFETKMLVIAPIENEYRPGRQMKELDLFEGDGEGTLLQKLKDDINRLPDNDGSFDQFEEVPVEGFGAALMAGYGFKEGMGIGKNAKQDMKVVEYKGWVGRKGLGASSDVHENSDQ